MNRPSVIALDGDNTLWRDRNEFVVTRERFHELLAPYLPANGRAVDEKLDGIARKFLALHGYTLSGFSQALSDTAAEVAGGAVPADVRKALESLSREMQEHPLALVDGTRSVLTQLTERGHILWLVTRGELLEQASKVARSGLTSLFARVEVVQHKGAATYGRLLERDGIDPSRFVMVGDTLLEDVLPVLHLGAQAFHVPDQLGKAKRAVERVVAGERFQPLRSLGDLPEAISLRSV